MSRPLDRTSADGMSNHDDSDDDIPPLPDDAAEEDDDAPQVEEEAASTHAEGESPKPRSRMPLFMFGAAGALWMGFALMRCDRDDAQVHVPAAVTEAPSSDEEPPELPSVAPDPTPSADPDPADVDGLEDEAPTPAGADKPEVDGLPDAEEGGAAGTFETGDFDPRPKVAAWAKSMRSPNEVKYVVRRGGSLENVANLYKIFHHEIQELNPGVGLGTQLPPKSAVVVYKANGDVTSQSIGGPSSGKLEGGVPMVDGPGRVMKMIGWKSFATANTVAVLDTVLRRWAKTGHRQPVLVGNMSSRNGGRLKPHSTHQSGRDVDLGYPQKLPAGEELNWRLMTDRNLDAKETWALLSMLVQTGQIEVIYIDREIQKLLHSYATKNGLMSKATLARWMEYPSPTGSGSPVIQHVKGHADHMHARFKCQPHESQCKSRKR